MTRTVSIVSGKGGVGKTTFSANLALALSEKGKEVTLIDGDFAGANISDHFGMDVSTATLNDVVNGDAYITQSLYRHSSGISILPADLYDYDFETEHLKHAVLEFLGNRDYIIIDGPPGAKKPLESVLEASNETVLVTEPVKPSVRNALAIKNKADEMGVGITGVVLNRVFGDHVEMSDSEVEDMLDEEVIGTIPHHRHVRESINQGEPVYSYKPYSRVSKEIEKVAHKIEGDRYGGRGFLREVRDGFMRMLD